ncbi:DUF2530 domain-containing protein [Streptomyces sp. TRM66268-LWL]|uniref:DUF2530 domain-containing protein n=1 Tax=Streptomyces polyasparticus TaxID=2767826 RepID=A0ABR7SPF0_9ACTN|nr:DUF2530 domain-containing protein [Streptomyces polyasparticus]MBC9716472.1 DUF2530 domain-containing protein [Streptomyces polyasparticus]
MAKWEAKHEAPEPLEGPVVATITGGTILWFVLFLVQVPFYGWFDDRDLTWWVWTCLAGAGLGLIGIWYVRGRDAALKRHAAERDTAEREAAEREAAEREAAERDARTQEPTEGAGA